MLFQTVKCLTKVKVSNQSIIKKSNQFCWDSLFLVNIFWLFPGTLLFLFLGILSRMVVSIIFLETEGRPAVPGVQGFSLLKKKEKNIFSFL